MSTITKLHSPLEPWVHLELGAANYGIEGHSGGKCPGGHEAQLLPLYHTIDELVQTHGPNTPGTFYINDLYQKACEYACERLQTYISKEYPKTAIRVAAIVKSYFEIEIPVDCRVKKVNSIHFKNPEKYQLESASLKPNWLLEMSQRSLSSLTLITGYQENFFNSKYLSPAGKKSEIPLHYEEDPVRPLKYLYIDPNGNVDAGWRNVTRRYSIRTATPEEQYPPAELSERWNKKQLITQKIECLAKEVFEKTIANNTNNPKYPLIRAFDQRRCLSTEKNNPFTFNIFDLDAVENLDDSVLHKYVAKIEEQNAVISSFFSESYRRIEEPVGFASQSVPGKLNFLTLKRYHSSKTPEQLWDRLGLGKAYRETFPNDAAFWNCDSSLNEIYNYLMTKNNVSS